MLINIQKLYSTLCLTLTKESEMIKNVIHRIFNPFNLNITVFNLHFRDQKLEKEFTHEYKTKNLSLNILFTTFSILIYGAFFYINPPLSNNWFSAMLILAFLIGFSVYFKVVQKFLYLALMSYSLIIGSSYVLTMQPLPETDMYHIATNFMGFMLLLFAINSFLRTKIAYAFVSNIVIFLLYLVNSALIIRVQQADPIYLSYSLLILFSVIIISCISIYNMEYMYRNDFVQRKEIQGRANELKEAKEAIEEKVIERTKELEIERAKSLRAIIEGQEIERQRIAQDLHDSLNIRMIGLKRMIEQTDRPKSNELLTELDSIISQVREISHNLSPYSLKHLGLVKAIEDLCSRLEKQHNFNIQFRKININENARWDPTLEIELFKVIQELIANIIKHAQANNITIELIADNNMLYLSVEDDGIGFEYDRAKSKGIGLNNVNARISLLGGSISYDTRPGNGTTVMINLPKSI
jgi:signal transduction histidine kinase